MYTSGTRYIPRHAAETRLEAALRDGMKAMKTAWAQARDAARKAARWAEKTARRIDARMDEEMTGAGLVLCGLLMGLVIWPLILFCYFA